MSRSAALTIIVVLAATVSIFAIRPSNMNAFFRSGQVFITWDEVANGQKYVVYSSTAPITTENIASAVKRIERAQGSAGNKMLNYLGGASFSTLNPPCTFTRNVITPLADGQSGMASAVDSGTGMIVLTSHQAGGFYYAVTAFTGGVEDKSCDAGNSVGPVNEVVEEPVPVLIWRSNIMLARIYLQYTDVDSFNPTMCNTYAFTYWVGVPSNYNTTSGTLPLELFLDGSPGNMPAVGDDCRYYCEGINLKIQDNRTWWYGYSQTFPYDTSYLYFAGGPVATSGPVINFTQARIMNMLKWMILREPYYSSRIDTNAIHVLGGSMGGGGTLMFLQSYPDFFAYGRAGVPPTNYFENGDWQYTGWITPIWGLGNNDNMKVGFTGWRSEKLNEKYAGVTVHKWLNMESFLRENRKLEMPWVCVGHGGQDNSVNYPTHGKNYYPALLDTKHGFSGGVCGSCGHGTQTWMYENNQVSQLRKNESFLACSNTKSSAALPLPEDPDVATDYSFHCHFIWSTPHYRVGGYQNQVDSTNRYEIVVASYKILGGTVRMPDDTADVTPRRLQRFIVEPGAQYIIKNTASNDTNVLYQMDTVAADTDGLVTFEGFIIKAGDQNTGGSRFIMVPCKDCPGSKITGNSRKEAGTHITCSPNPFNPDIKITVSGNNLSDVDQRYEIGIYNIKGKLMDRFSVTGLQLSAGIQWNAADKPSGVYIVKIKIEKTVFTKNVFLLR